MMNRSELRALVARDPVEVYKSDRRSRVWVAHDVRLGRVVIKRWEHAPWRQRLAGWVGLHPAQWEARMNRMLAGLGISVVPVLARGVVRSWWGDRYWLATPLWGRSLQRWLMRSAAGAPGQGGGALPWQARLRATLGLAHLVVRLLEHKLVFRDLKSSNVVADPRGQVWLIDVGSMRRSRASEPRLRMLAMLDKTVAADGATRTDRLRFLKAVAGVWPDWADVRVISRQILAARERLP